MIEFSIPDFWYHFQLNLSLLDLMHEQPDKFNEDVKIISCYGSFPCVWNGGRYITGPTPDYSSIVSGMNEFYSRGVILRHTFTNTCLNDNAIYDTVGNSILMASDPQFTQITIADQVLSNYLQKTYPRIKQVLSTTLGIKDIDKINEVTKDKLLIPDFSINNDFNTLDKIQNPENIEILIGELCVDNCAFRHDHHIKCASLQACAQYKGEFVSCPHLVEFQNLYDVLPNRKHTITLDSIRQDYVPRGFNKFKISGRMEHPAIVIEKYVLYLVKPEYQNYIRQELLIKNIRPNSEG